jgi:hypothetical protein
MRVVAAVAPLGGRAARGQPPRPLRSSGADTAALAVEEIRTWDTAGATDYALDVPASSLEELRDALPWCVEVALPAAGLTVAAR